MSDLRINISRLSEGRHEFDLEAEPSEVGLDERFDQKVKVHAHLEKSGRQLALRARLSSSGKFTCDRCLDQFRKELVAQYSIVYSQEQHPSTLTEEGEQELQIIGSDVNMIDLGEDVRQFLLLSVPVKLLCKEDCKGLCPSCGTNLNRNQCSCSANDVDPRWAALKKFSDN